MEENILNTDIKFLQGIGPKRAEVLSKEANIHTFRDMLYYFPYRWIDRTKVETIKNLYVSNLNIPNYDNEVLSLDNNSFSDTVTEVSSNTYVQLRGKIISVETIGYKTNKKRLEAILKDSTGEIKLVFFSGLKWILEKLTIGDEYIVFGKITIFKNDITIVHPEIDLPEKALSFGVGKMAGIYRMTEKMKNGGLGIKAITKIESVLLAKVLPNLEETLPDYLIKAAGLCSLSDALKNIHFPLNTNALSRAQYRLKFEELFYLQLGLLKQKHNRREKLRGVVMKNVGDNFYKCYNSLPYSLTGAQKRVIKEMREDLRSGNQMNRLLQGDVGSGKTLVAVLISLIVIDNGFQACIMAPTEVLAQQHYKNISKFLLNTEAKCALLTGSTKKREREELHKKLQDGEIDILIGTHALIEDTVVFKKLGLSIIDEQHRFGVEQRSKLWKKNLLTSDKLSVVPHILVMTATPIPRTLSMTLYGDLDLSVIDELPPGRTPIVTKHFYESRRGEVFAFMRGQIKLGRQVFVVYPLIKESEKMDYENLEIGYQRILEEFPYPVYKTAVVHGKQKSEDKEYGMNVFANGGAQILVSTSVIEVGVDVPNASVMVIESAERFGLSQLHQLRGRVGRGSKDSYCILMTGVKLSKESKKRIDLMCSTTDGFLLAEEDMKMRGPGDIEGTNQSGLSMNLNISSLYKDGVILDEARRWASQILEDDPSLQFGVNQILSKQLLILKKGGKDFKDYSIVS